MQIENCSPKDFQSITSDIIEFWDSDRTLVHHHPFLIYEFGNTAFVIKDNGVIAAYLLGFYSQTEKTAYVHLIGVRQEYQRQGLGQKLYSHFIELAKKHGCTKIKAITSPPNKQSIAFHTQKIGMTMKGELNTDGIKIIKNYSGNNKDRVVFERDI